MSTVLDRAALTIIPIFFALFIEIPSACASSPGDARIAVLPGRGISASVSPLSVTPSLRVHVQDLLTGNPIKDASVSVAVLESRLTDLHGNCVFQTISSGTYVIDVTKAGYYLIRKPTAVIIPLQTTELTIRVPLILQFLTTTLPIAETGTMYQQTLSVLGGEPPYRFSLISGALPGGITLDASNGVLLGRPTQAGNYTFKIRLTDSFSFVERTFSIEQVPPLEILAERVLPSGTRGSYYTYSFNFTGGKSPYTFLVTGGSFPAGLTLSASGVISGTPTAANVYHFDVRLSDGRGFSTSRDFYLEVFDPIAVQTAQLPNGIIGETYNHQLTFAGGNHYEGYRWFLQAGRLPAGLRVASSDSLTWWISGTPTEATSATLTLGVRDIDGRTAYRTYTLFVSDMDLSLGRKATFSGHRGPVSRVLFSPDGKTALTSSLDDQVLILWDVESGQSIYRLDRTNAILAADISPDGQYMITGDASGLISQWFARTGIFQLLFTGGHTSQVSSLQLSRDGDWLLTGGYDRRVNLWEVRILNNQRHWFVYKIYTGHTDRVTSVAFSPDESAILTGSWDKTARLWNKTTTNPIASFTGHTGPVTSADISPLGTQVITSAGEPDNTIRLWTWSESGAALVRRYWGHTGSVNAAAFLPDGNQFVTAGSDWTVKVWSTTGNSPTLSFDQPSSPAYSVAASPNGQYILSGHENAAYLRWMGPALEVSVKDHVTGIAISNATVTIAGGLSRLTDSQGIARFRYLPLGTYTLETQKTGYQALSSYQATTVPFQTVRTDILLTLGSGQPLNIFASTLPQAETGEFYHQTIAAGGGRAPYQYRVAYGVLPLGLSLHATTGIISGTPTTAGTYRFGLGVTDQNNSYVEKEFVIAQYNPLAVVTPERLPHGTVGVKYSQRLNVAGGLPPFLFSVSAGSLPAGMNLVAASGELTGTPTAKGEYTFTIRVKDDRNKTIERQFRLTVYDPISITMPRLFDGVVGRAFRQELTFTGGNPTVPFTWQVNAGKSFAGLQIIRQASQSWIVSGTPTVETYETIVFIASDQDGRSTSKSYLFRIVAPLTIDTISLPNGKQNETYNETIVVRGGVSPYRFSYTGQLPTGLTLNSNTGVISGVPTATQLSNFLLTVTDSTYSATQTAVESLGIRITSGLSILTPSILKNSIRNLQPESIALTAKGGNTPYRWSLAGGALPSGIAILAASGILSGTPIASGEFRFTLEVRDSLDMTAQKEFIWRVAEPLSIVTTTMSGAVVDTDFYCRIEAAGGIPPYKWKTSSGTLPTGFQFNTDTGVLYGKPVVKATATVTFEVNDNYSPARIARRSYLIAVEDNIQPTYRDLPDGQAGNVYSATFHTPIGIAPYTWRIAGGRLPTGILLEAASSHECRIAGTPIQDGSFTFRLAVTDSSAPAKNLSREYVLKILAGPPTPTPTPTYTLTPTIPATPTPSPTLIPTRTPTQKPTPTRTPTPRITPSPTATRTPTVNPNATPTPTRTVTHTPRPTNTPFITPTPLVKANIVNAYDDEASSVALEGWTDFDDLANRQIYLRWSYTGSLPITDWHIYVKRGDGGYFYIGRTANGLARSFAWIDPDINSQYQFRVWGLSPGGMAVLNQEKPIGFNLTGGSEIKLKRLANPDDIPAGKAIVTDDLLHGTDLSGGVDWDSYLERALALKWNFGEGAFSNAHIYISTDGINYSYMGQTGAGDLNYFRFDNNDTFSIHADWKAGPQPNTQYWFQVLALAEDGSVKALRTGPVVFYLRVDTATPTPVTPPVPTPIPGEIVTISIPGLPVNAKLLQLQPIHSGSFIMGSPPDEKDRHENESPQHQVTITRDFYLGRYEVTNAQFAAFLNAKGNLSLDQFPYMDTSDPANPIRQSGNLWIVDTGQENVPACLVSWYGARDFCAWISVLNPWLQGRLPTESEWEYACRAGTADRYYWGDDILETDLDDHAWYSGNAQNAPHEIGQKVPNDWNLFDMSGNAIEWCSDLFGAYPIEPQVDPLGADSGSIRVQRGGSYTSDPGRIRSARRRWDLPTVFGGFRVAAARKN